VERVEYERMHAVEDRMWWYRGLRTLVAELFTRALSRSPSAGAVLDAGCGTGGMLARLSPVPALALGLEYDPFAAALAAAKSGQPVAALIYQRQKHLINVFVWPASTEGSGARARTIRGFNVRHWVQNGMSLWAVSDLNDAELNEFVHAQQMSPPAR